MIRLPMIAVVLVIVQAGADEWPGWMGPNRDNVWRESGVLEKFPAGGPKVLWRSDVAGGYAGPAVVGANVFVTDFVSAADVKVDNFNRKEFNGTERVLCLDEATGKIKWKHEYPVNYDISYPAGPRCTPNVDGDHVYTLGAVGHLICFEIATGKIVWQKDLMKEYKTKAPLWGYAAHPLIDGDKLITLAGGEGSHAVAFDKKTGAEKWKTVTSKEQGYAPPTIIECAGVRQLILACPDQVTSVDPETGKQYWTTPYTATNGSIIMSPLMYKGHLFVAGYSNRNLLLKLDESKPGAQVVFKDKNKLAMSPVNVQPFNDDGTLYGCDQGGDLMAVDFLTGKRLWTSTEPFSKNKSAGSETIFLVRNGKTFWGFNELGELLTCKLSGNVMRKNNEPRFLSQPIMRLVDQWCGVHRRSRIARCSCAMTKSSFVSIWRNKHDRLVPQQ